MKTTSPRAPSPAARARVPRPLATRLLLATLCVLTCAPFLNARTAHAETTAIASVPASGQTKGYVADRGDDDAGPVEIPDDGRIRAGAALAFRDNGDGTISDLNTGLMWEKKCAECTGLHDVAARYHWSGDGEAETIWDWIERVNAEGGRGFAGYSDWRIPNVRELVSIVDYGALLPAVTREFHREAAERKCADATPVDCSRTDDGEYWTSTTFADFPAHALAVYFGMGLVNDRVKTGLRYVRAVRGGAR